MTTNGAGPQLAGSVPGRRAPPSWRPPRRQSRGAKIDAAAVATVQDLAEAGGSTASYAAPWDTAFLTDQTLCNTVPPTLGKECMARPRSEDKRDAILAAAVRVIAAQGLSAPTATIAKEAGVSNGSLFTYFETKADLLNQLYMELKAEMGAAASDGLPPEGDVRSQLLHMWSGWLRWATSSPEKRRALAHLGVSDDITPESHRTASQALAGIREILQRSHENGPMRQAPLGFVVALMSALADTTTDFMLRDPANADKHGAAAFEALWRIVA